MEAFVDLDIEHIVDQVDVDRVVDSEELRELDDDTELDTAADLVVEDHRLEDSRVGIDFVEDILKIILALIFCSHKILIFILPG